MRIVAFGLLVGLLFAGLLGCRDVHAQFSLPESMPELDRGAMLCNKGETVCLVNLADFKIVVDVAKGAEAMRILAGRLGEDLEGKNAYIERLEARLNACHPPATLNIVPRIPGRVVVR